LEWPALAVIAIIIIMIFCFITEVIPIDTTALLVMTVLITTGLVTPLEGISGFSNEATITILALFIIGAGLDNSGAINYLGKKLQKFFLNDEWLVIAMVMLLVGFLSAFMNNTAIVVVFMPILLRISRVTELSSNRLLMSLSFAAMMGGATTVIGTSTNLLVSSMAAQSGIEGFKIFEFTPLGIILFLGFFVFMLGVGRFLIPKRKPATLASAYQLKDFVTEFVVPVASPLVGKTLQSLPFFNDPDVTVIEVIRQGKTVWLPRGNEIMQAHDTILIKGGVDDIVNIKSLQGLTFPKDFSEIDRDLDTGELALAEVMVLPSSKIVGRKMKRIAFKEIYNAVPLAVKKKGGVYSGKQANYRPQIGDTILLETQKNNLAFLNNHQDLGVLYEHSRQVFDWRKIVFSFFVVTLVVFLAAFDIVPILTSSLIGCTLMLISKSVSLQKAYQFVEWKVIFLLAGLLPLGIAIHNTGLDQIVGDAIYNLTQDWPVQLTISLLFLITVILTSVISNQATAILLVPVAISLATDMGMAPKPFLLTVLFAASTSFITPIGYQTNTLIYGVGSLKFTDFLKVGGVLTLVIWLMASFLIPLFYF
jgi:di/tricarboxylate transporter